MKKAKALVLLSGGLDSSLAARVLIDQGIDVTGICFSSNFFNCDRGRKAAEQLDIPLIEEDLSEKILEVVKCPSCGYGKNMNPCIDCHSTMIKEAAKYLKPEIKNDPEMANQTFSQTIGQASKGKDVFDFIATGEVLGQRPFSQNKESLSKVKKLAGIEVLRPLSAKLLPETAIEKKGLVKRYELLDIQGRQRERQMQMAEKYGIKDYPSPAGGCLLTDPEGAKKVLDIVMHCPDCKVEDVELLKNGRVFWLKIRGENESQKVPKVSLSLKDALKSLTGVNIKDVKVEADINFHWVLVVVGRNDEENQRLEKLAKKGDIVVKLDKMMGPTTIARLEKLDLPGRNEAMEIEVPDKFNLEKFETEKIKNEKEIFEIIGLLTGYYSTKARGKKVDVNLEVK